MLSDSLLLSSDLPIPPDWRRLGEHLPYEWIEQALVLTDKASIRQRRMPAQQVVWLVIALALYRHHSIAEVVADLDLALPGMEERFVTASAITQARQRLGAEPLQWLFETSAKAWIAQDSAHAQWHGLQLLAMDGTTLRLPDSQANRAHFGAANYANDSVASYPQTRGVTISMLATQLVLAAHFDAYHVSEMTMAKQLLPQIPDQSLTLFDRGFISAELLCALGRNGQQRHYLIPAKSTTRWIVIEGDADDALVEMKVSHAARKRDPELALTWRSRAIKVTGPTGRSAYLLTSLTDRRRYPATQINACYARRWQIETSYRELKHSMLGMALTLRSQSVAGVQQEIWGAFIAYNLVRLEIAKAALQAKCAPTDISFVLALHTIQYELMCAASTQAQGKIPALLVRLRQRLVLDLKTQRPGRTFDRVVKTKAQRYPEVRLKKNLSA